MSTSTVLSVAVGLVALSALVTVLVHNRLVSLRARVANAWAQIDVQLQRRHELVPNLVEVAKGYLQHERETLLAVTAARENASDRLRAAGPAGAGGLGAVEALASAERTLSGALGQMRIVMEAYPELKADAHMRELADELEHTENRVAYARQAYADAVMAYNAAQQQVPGALVARLSGLTPAVQFEVASETMRAPVGVSFA